MPITKQAIKRMKQNRVAKARNKHYGSRMKSLMKLVLGYVQKGEMDKAKKTLPEAVKAIDTAAKKNILHKNNAARKKSKIQRAVNVGPTKKIEEKPAKKAAEKKVETKKEAPKKEEVKEVKAETEVEEESKAEEKKD